MHKATTYFSLANLKAYYVKSNIIAADNLYIFVLEFSLAAKI